MAGKVTRGSKSSDTKQDNTVMREAERKAKKRNRRIVV